MIPQGLFSNGIWLGVCAPNHFRYLKAIGNTAAAQRQILMSYMRRNADTVYGRRYGFGKIRSVKAFQTRVPLTTYEDYAPYIKRVAAGEESILTSSPVRLLQPSSGSTTAAKLIPYTRELHREFNRALAPWIFDLYQSDPRLLVGRAYWSISPVTLIEFERTESRVPVGFEEDTEYLGGVIKHLVGTNLAVPADVRFIEDMEAFRYVTLLFLLRSADLSLISVWNPTFLTLLVEKLQDWWPQLADHIGKGVIAPSIPLAPRPRERLEKRNHPLPRRAAQIRDIFRTGQDAAAVYAQLWPRLRLISCWADGNAESYAHDLAGLFPQACLQPKGVIATEGFISFPVRSAKGALLAVRSHFFEFLPEGGGKPFLAHELEQGCRYSVVMTTGGGFYRYRLMDLVEVTGRVKTCPVIRFIGKEDQVSDWFGEKLNEKHVRQSLKSALSRYRLRPGFAMVACETESSPPAYTLFLELEGGSKGTFRRLAMDLDAALRVNYHYRYCRGLGQLGPLQIFLIEGDAQESYLAACGRHGQRIGDVKSICLSPRNGWSRFFRGRVITKET